MSLIIAVQKLTQIHNNKKLNLEQIFKVLSQVPKQKDNILLSQKMSILSLILNFLFIATKTYIYQITKFRYEICFDPFKSTSQRKNRNVSTLKKARERLAYKKENKLTVDQILVQAIKQGMSQVDNSIGLITPRREAIILQNIVTTIPPFGVDFIAQLSEDESVISKLPTKTFNKTVGEQKMMTYLKILDLASNEVNISSINPKIDRTVVDNPKRTVKKRKTMKHDNEIYLQQGLDKIHHIQRLSTKIKIRRQLQKIQINSFQNKIKACNPKLTNNKLILQKLSQKMKRERKQNDYQQQIHMQVQMRSLSQYKNQCQNDQSNFIINQQNSPSITKAIQSKLNAIMLDQFFTQQKVSFQKFANKKKINRDIKGELFYQLLHMDFPLEQARPDNFGQIFILKKSQLMQ